MLYLLVMIEATGDCETARWNPIPNILLCCKHWNDFTENVVIMRLDKVNLPYAINWYTICIMFSFKIMIDQKQRSKWMKHKRFPISNTLATAVKLELLINNWHNSTSSCNSNHWCVMQHRKDAGGLSFLCYPSSLTGTETRSPQQDLQMALEKIPLCLSI